MSELIACPVCRGAFGLCRQRSTGGRDSSGFSCDGCGQFEITRSALVTWFKPDGRLSAMQRAALSHALRTASRGADPLVVTTAWMEAFSRDARLPTPAAQATNLLARIGDVQSETGEGCFIDDVTDAPLIGAFNRQMFGALLQEVAASGLLKTIAQASVPNPREIGVLSGYTYGLTLEGWRLYEAERRGRFSGQYGFIAMKFGDPVLEPFLERVIKPGVREGIGLDVVDLRNVSRAGVIDNILRAQIRDAAFVLVDLTHDNAGAYWEAGYAEGLNKPVVYLCERAKFEAAKTHFDTNHCTTVMWSADDPAPFLEALVATLRRSLNLFATDAGTVA